MTSRKLLAVIVVCVALVVIAAAVAFVIRAPGSGEEVDVEGGVLIVHGPDELVVRCLSPELTLHTDDFVGNVTICNSFPGSDLDGYDQSPTWNGTSVSFQVLGGNREYKLIAPEKQQFSFAVMGDSQGHNDVLEKALNMTTGCDFVIHCGDLTPSGGSYEFAAVEEALNTSCVPVFTTPGNHDTKNYGPEGYIARFGPVDYYFDYGGIRFAFVDSSNESITPEQISWLGKTFSGADRKVIVTHVPCYDPFGNNHTLDPASCERIHNFALDNGVTAVFTGHIHAYYILTSENTDFVITGGAGGSLVNGTYHWLRVNVTSSSFTYDKVDIERGASLPTVLTIKGHGMMTNLTLDDLSAMQQIEGDSSYQNQFGNIGGTGHYKGVAISSLLNLVGNMTDGEVLKVTATDGYYQEYGYGNVYPNTTWLELQGPIILALSFNGSEIPDWQDGPRIAMLPSDGLYSNPDCDATSYPGQGYSLYPSAGARWVKNVVVIEVVS